MNDYAVGTKLFVVDAGSGSRGVNDESVTVIPHEYVQQGYYKENEGFTVIVNNTGSRWNVLKEGEYIVLDEIKEKSMFEILAERMGVEIGEKFKFVELPCNDVFILYKDGLKYNLGSTLAEKRVLTDALNGKLTAVKLHWTPDRWEKYYMPHGDGLVRVYENNTQSLADIAIKNSMCFKTKKEAYQRGIDLGWEMKEINE